jgi:hypothetical protein
VGLRYIKRKLLITGGQTRLVVFLSQLESGFAVRFRFRSETGDMEAKIVSL